MLCHIPKVELKLNECRASLVRGKKSFLNAYAFKNRIAIKFLEIR